MTRTSYLRVRATILGPAGTGAPAWLAVMAELHKYLSGGPAEENRSVGSVIDETFDAARYRPGLTRQVMTIDAGKNDRGQDAEVLLEAHRLRVERGDYNIAQEHLADAIELLVLRSTASLSDDRSPANPY